MGQKLTLETRMAFFCYCLKTANSAGGWTVDPVTRRSVCYLCRKPAPMTGIRICSDCECEFVDFEQKRFIVWPDGRVTEAVVYCEECA